MKSVLIVTRDFTPYCGQAGWMMRAVTMANFLAAHGCEVTVVAARRSQPAATLDLHPSVKVHWVRDMLEHFRYDSRAWLRFPARALGVLVVRVCRMLRFHSIDRTMFSLPWYRECIQKAVRERDIMNIIISTPPHSLQTLATWMRSAYPNVNLISDFRDAWSLRPLHGAQRWVTEKEENMEREVLSQVDHALFVSDGMKDLYTSKYDIEHPVTVQNGFSDTPPGKVELRFSETVEQYKQAGRIVLGYFGSGSVGIDGHEKDLAILLRAIESDSDLQENLAVVIQGNININPLFKTKAEYSVFKRVAYPVVKAHMGLVDLGVNLFSFSLEYAPGVVAGKTYEYICSGVPFIAVVPRTAKSLKAIVEDTSGYFCDINDTNSIATTLSKVVVERKEIGATNRLRISDEKRRRYSRAHQYEKVLKLLV